MLNWLILIAAAVLIAVVVGWIWDSGRVPGWDEPKDPAWGLKHPRTPPPPSNPSESEKH